MAMQALPLSPSLPQPWNEAPLHAMWPTTLTNTGLGMPGGKTESLQVAQSAHGQCWSDPTSQGTTAHAQCWSARRVDY